VFFLKVVSKTENTESLNNAESKVENFGLCQFESIQLTEVFLCCPVQVLSWPHACINFVREC